MRKVLIFFAVLGITIGLIVGVDSVLSSENENADNETLNVVEETKSINELSIAISDVDTFNPLRTKNSHLADVLKVVYEPLVTFNQENQLEACLATEWAKSSDSTWIIRIRENVRWHRWGTFYCC